MNIKWQYGLFTTCLLAAISVLVFREFRDSLLYLAIAEGLIAILVMVAFIIYGKIFKPLDQLKLGSEALRHQDFTNKMKYTDSPEMNNLVGVYNNMIENIRKERVFQQEQHYFLQLLVDALPVGILILDYDGRLSEYNPEAERMLNLQPNVVGKPIKEVDARLGKEISRMGINENTNFRIGSNRHYRCLINKFMHRGFARRFVILEDISSEVMEIEKKSYGKVIRMMAHEVNNSVGAVNSILDSLLSGSHMDDAEIREYLTIIFHRNKNLNQFMQNFADVVRIPPPNPVQANVNDLVRRVFRLMKSRAGERDLTFDLILPIKRVVASMDEEQIEQVLINVILNAMEAIEGKGTITVELRAQPVSIRVTDNGSGLSPEEAEKIFTPFFSTKPTGQGVGLTMVREILNNHGFRYDLRSENGITVFEVEV